MKFKILALLSVFLMVFFIIGGCGETTETNQPPESEGEETVPAEETAPQEPPQREGKVMSEELTQLLAKAGQKVTSMQYLYYGPPDDEIGYSFYVLGEKIKVVLPSNVKFDTDVYYETVYLDTGKKTAYGYCEAPGCIDKERALTVKYADYIRETPLDKLKLVVYGEIKGDEAIETRQTKVVEFESKNTTGKMWIDTFSGLPLRIEENVKGEVVSTEFRSINVNSVKEADVTH